MRIRTRTSRAYDHENPLRPMRTPTLLGTLGILAILLPANPASPSSRSALRPDPGPGTALQENAVPTDDPVARLQERMASGEVTLAYDTLTGYLPALLEELEIPVSSQTLVFSRTSLQTDRIAPWTPRALYFNDEVYVGYVQESPFLEIASIDPQDGAVFYTLSQVDPDSTGFQHETTTCLMCHESRAVTGGVPGLIVRSVLSDRLGYPITGVHEGTTTDRTPIEDRWGGWYVTGTLEGLTHAGNVHAPVLSHEVTQTRRYKEEMDLTAGTGVTDLEDRFYVDAYLTPHSDVVALMVLTHQAQVHNLITMLYVESMKALEMQAMVLKARGEEPPSGGYLETTLAHLQGPIERLVQTMLFSNEAPLAGPVQGTSSFAEEFSARGPHDDQGRSLRELDLEKRLFRYPLSFLIYTDAFEALPDVAKQGVARRFREVLSGEDQGEDFQHLTEADRVAITEILRDTKPGFLSVAVE